MKRVAAMILAGGRGKRMGILCQKRPKPVLAFAGKYHVIDFSLSNCINSGIHSIAVMADYQGHYLKKYLGNGSPWAPAHYQNLHILEAKANHYKGTADAIYQNLDYVYRSGANRILILAADHVYKMDYRKMLLFHEQAKADVTVGVIPVPIKQAHRFGIVTSNDKGRITDFIEKPRIPLSNLASMGIYIFNKEVLVKRLTEDAALLSSPHDFGHAILPEIVRQDRVFAYEFKDYWQDIGTIEAYYEANMELIDEIRSSILDDKEPIFTAERDLPPPEVTTTGSVSHSLISPGCVVKGKVINSILSPTVRIEEQTEVQNSIIMSGTIINEHSVVAQCILDENVNIGKFCYIGFGANLDMSGKQLTVLGENVIVPSYTAIGRNCRIEPDVDSTDFQTNSIPAGTTIHKRQYREIIEHTLDLSLVK